MKKGFTLIELSVAMLISTIALFGIGTLIDLSFKDWRESREIVALQDDLDLANYTLKGVLEEADTVSIPDETHISAGYKTDWKKEFYRNGNKLILKNLKNSKLEEVIDCLENISFRQPDAHLVKIDLKVKKGKQELENSLIIYLRNK